MKTDKEIINIFKKDLKFSIGLSFIGIIVGMLFVCFLIFTCDIEGILIFFIAMVLFCCMEGIYEVYLRFYNLKCIRKGNYSICVKPTVGEVNTDSRGGLYIRVKDCNENFGFTSDKIKNFSNKVYCVTTKKGTYAVCFCKKDY